MRAIPKIDKSLFPDEARLAAQLSHPNVVQTFEVEEEGSRHFMVMEYLDGAMRRDSTQLFFSQRIRRRPRRNVLCARAAADERLRHSR
jgi:serine/threonine-protein kinase